MAYKTCPDCGSRIFEHGCVNCNEADYISMQEPYGEDRFRQVVGGRNAGKEYLSKCKAGDDQRFYLSTEGYYFKYRPDRNDSRIIRATLYRVSNGEQVDDVRVSEGYGLPEKSHYDLINYFEARLSIGQIK